MGINLRSMILSVVLISGLIIGMSTFIGDMFESYSVNEESVDRIRDMESISRSQEMKNKTRGFKEKVSDIKGESGWDWGMFIGVVASVGGYLLFLPGTIIGMIGDLFNTAKFIPMWFQVMVWSSIVIIAVFVIADYILNRRSNV